MNESPRHCGSRSSNGHPSAETAVRAVSEDLARQIMEVAQVCADGYRRSVSQFNLPHENDAALKCSMAASNTGMFILERLGYSFAESRKLLRTFKASTVSDDRSATDASEVVR